MKKKILFISFGILIVLFSLTFASAEFWKCFNQKEEIKFCDDYRPSETCDKAAGCTWCMSVYREGENCYIHGSWPKCLKLPPTECNKANGNASLDREAPNMTIYSPKQDDIFASKSLPVNIVLSELGNIYYYDNINGRGKWMKVCSNCISYNKSRSFREGLNDITFKAFDMSNNEINKTLSFFVDSKKPQIHKTEPRSRYAGGLFSIQYSEDNLKSIKISYGNIAQGFQNKTLTNCSSGFKSWCYISANLSLYEGKDISYYFIVEDKAGNIKMSKRINLKVDTTPPFLNNPTSFWKQGTGKLQNYIYFNFSVTEENLDQISYSYTDTTGKLKEKRLCSGLKDGWCYAKATFKPGHYALTVKIIDEAGNSISKPVVFNVL